MTSVFGPGFDSPQLHLRPPIALAKEGFFILAEFHSLNLSPGYGGRSPQKEK